MNNASFTSRTLKEAQAFYQEQPLEIKQCLRRIAANKLIEQGYEEVGSSDVSIKVMSMLQHCESVLDTMDA
jgi:hypothetical protein